MAGIKLDVVSIQIDVPQNPFSDLIEGINEIKAELWIFKDAANGIENIGVAIRFAAKDVNRFSDSIHAPPAGLLAGPVNEMMIKMKKAKLSVKALGSEMVQAGKQKLTDVAHGLNKGLSETVARLKNVLGLEDKLNGAGFGETVKRIKSLAQQAANVAKSLGGGALNGLKTIGKGVASGMGTAASALKAGAGAAFDFGSAYETSMAKVSTKLDTSVISPQDLNSQVMTLSNETGADASGLNDAVYQALSAGADSGQVVSLVGTAVKAAKGGFTDTETAVEGLTSTLNAYGMATKEAESLANQFIIAQNNGKTTFGELAASISGIAPTAKEAGVGVDQLLAGAAAMTAGGLGTDEAMNGIEAALSNVVKPSSEAESMAKSLGLEFNSAALQSKGLAGFLDEVKAATGGDADKMEELFGSVEALNTVLTLTSDQGSQLMADTLNEMVTNTGVVDAAYGVMAGTAQESVNKGLNTFKNLGIGIYQSNEGAVSGLTNLFASSGQELYDAFATGGMEGLGAQIGTTLSNIAVTLVSYLPQLVQSGGTIVNSLIQGIMQNREQITSAVVSGIIILLTGLLQMMPRLLITGVAMLGSLLQGLAQQMPGLIAVGVTAIQNLCVGLLANAPTIIQSGISLILGLIGGIIAVAPTILTTGIQLIIMLAQGLVAAIPQLIQTIPLLVSAIITTLLSVDWLKLGLDIIKGIGSGLTKGIKGLFSMGKDAGKEVGDGVTAGMNESIGEVTASVDAGDQTAVNGIPPVSCSDYGMKSVDDLTDGVLASAPAVTAAGGMITDDFYSSIYPIQETSGIGSEAVKQLAGSMKAELHPMQDVYGQEPQSAGFQCTGGIPAGMPETENWSAAVGVLPDQTKQSFGLIPDIVEEALTKTKDIVTTSLNDINLQSHTPLLETEKRFRMFGLSLETIFSSIQLSGAGFQIMAGLNQGMLGMKEMVIATATGIAVGISSAINQALEIHSPSKVMEQTGEYTDLGLVRGMKKQQGKMTGTAFKLGETANGVMSPVRSRYSPESSVSTAQSSSIQDNYYSPTFNLTLNGASASDSNERKVKRWVKDAMNNFVENIGYKNPRIQEV